MNISISQLQNRLEAIVDYLKPFKVFVNCHMVTYLTDDLWTTLIPLSIQKEIKTVDDIQTATDLFYRQNQYDSNVNEKFENFLKFVEDSKKFSLENMPDICSSITELKRTFAEKHMSFSENDDTLPIKEFFSEKKRYEVEVTANIVANLCKHKSADSPLMCIDAGDGKGYLSSRLALEYNLKVLGIDANAINTDGAKKRVQKLQKAWSGLTRRAEDIKNGKTPPRRGKGDRLPSDQKLPPNQHQFYKQITHFITPNTNLNNLIVEHFPIEHNETEFCLSGLHTCGNLASTCLKMFAVNPTIQCLCNVGCCYHLLDESFKKDEFYGSKKFACDSVENDGFPLSEYLREKFYVLGRNARMLASQSIARTLNKPGSDVCSTKPLYYRALLEIILHESNISHSTVQVGKIKKFSGFNDYIRQCLNRANINVTYDDRKLTDLLDKYRDDEHFLNLFYLIRMCFAPILETVILLDRLLYLKEQSIESACIVQLFDPVISPRCYGIVAVKNK